jgi:hypothetical protein
VKVLAQQHIEHDQHRRGGDILGWRIAEPFEARAELLIEHRELAIQDEAGKL